METMNRRQALLPIAALVSVGAAAVASAAVPDQSQFMQAAKAYKELFKANPFGETEDGEDEWSRQLALSEERVLQAPLTSNRDAAELVGFIKIEELSDAGDQIALEKLIQFLSAGRT